MKLALDKIAYIVLWVYAKNHKKRRVNHISCGGYLNTPSEG